jgi:hypothetical protein
MRTVGQYIYGVRTLLKEYSDDARPSNRYIFARLKAVRNNFLKLANDKGKLLNSSAIQYINFIELKPVDSVEYCDIDAGSIIYKSTKPIPRILDTSYGRQALKCYSIDRSQKLEFKPLDVIIAQANKKYKFPSKSFFIENDYLYTDEVEAVKLGGLFADPELIEDYNNCYTQKSCDNCEEVDIKCPTPMLERPFPIPEYMEKDIEMATAKDIASFYSVVAEDKTNNAKDDAPINQQANSKKTN